MLNKCLVLKIQCLFCGERVFAKYLSEMNKKLFIISPLKDKYACFSIKGFTKTLFH